MSGKTIATIYFYLISAGAIILMVIGIFNAVNFVVNSTQYEKYPLRYGGISNCEFANDGRYFGVTSIAPEKPMIGPGESTPSAAEIQRNKDICLKNEDAERTLHRVEDMKNAITFSLVGLVLFLIHFPQAKKRSV